MCKESECPLNNGAWPFLVNARVHDIFLPCLYTTYLILLDYFKLLFFWPQLDLAFERSELSWVLEEVKALKAFMEKHSQLSAVVERSAMQCG